MFHFLQKNTQKNSQCLIYYASVHSCEVNWFYFVLAFLEFIQEGRHRTNNKVLRTQKKKKGFENCQQTFQVTLSILLNNQSACE